jgi:hypothetical protein
MTDRAHFEADPVLTALMSAPADDAPESDEERAAVEEAMVEIRAGRWLEHDELRARIARQRLDMDEP